MLGHQFNPLSVYFCHRREGGLQALVYEVHNTFGERHSYLMPLRTPPQPGQPLVQRCAKAFHVSPFMGMDMQYEFRTVPPHGDALSLDISSRDAAGPMLVTRYVARRRELTDAALLGLCLTHPLLGLKVVAAIHLEALKLWLKKAPLHRHHPTSGDSYTFVETEEAP